MPKPTTGSDVVPPVHDDPVDLDVLTEAITALVRHEAGCAECDRLLPDGECEERARLKAAWRRIRQRRELREAALNASAAMAAIREDKSVNADLTPPPNVLLSGIVGSTAYGLATEDSDVDRLGLFAAPTHELLGLHPVQQSVVSCKPDATFHEAGKFASLALKVNPTITELLWLPDDLYETRTGLGNALIAIRSRFLSQKAVRNAYLGYATQQFRRLENRGDGSFSADTRKRTEKHARHLYRLHAQGIMLWQTGCLAVRLPHGDAVLCRAFGEKVAGGDLEAGRKVIEWAEHIFDTSRSPLPERPDEGPVEDWLQDVRREHYAMAVRQ